MPNKLAGPRPHITCPTVRPAFCPSIVLSRAHLRFAPQKMGPSQKCAPERLCSSALSLSTSQNLIFPLSTIPPPRMIFNETVAATTAAEQINGDGDKIHGRHATPPSHHIEYREISVVWGRWTESKCVPRRLKRYGMIWFQRGKGVTDLPDHVLYTDLSKL